MTVVKNGATEILPTDEPDDDCVVIPNPEGYQPVETIANEEVEDYVNVSNFGGCSQPVDTFIDEEDGHDQSPPEFLTGAMRKFPAFNDDRKFGWRLTISHAYATSTKHQVLHIPADTVKQVLKNRKIIVIRTPHKLDGIKCNIVTYKRKPGKMEMYLSKDPPEAVAVDIIRGSS
ncbi:hypothetical protein P8452_04095 [Trifolium repens]|nr:hypothetical protein P8452_04095 [Trifolium repens]